MTAASANPAAEHSATRQDYVAATDALNAADPVIQRLAADTGGVYVPRRRLTPFSALVQAIVYQQLAESAAHAIYRRLLTALGSIAEPSAILAMSDEDLRSVGLSHNKARSLRDLAAKVVDGRLDLRPRALARRTDDEIISRLSYVRGIGVWSAQMFLIFQMRRLDVWPVSDLGVRRAYGVGRERPTPTARELEPLGEPYKPYRTVLAVYCWKADAAARHR